MTNPLASATGRAQTVNDLNQIPHAVRAGQYEDFPFKFYRP